MIPRHIQKFRFRSQDYSQFLEGSGFEKFGIRKKVSISVSENLVSVSVLKNLASEKKSQYRFQSKFGSRHSVIMSQGFKRITIQ